MVGRSELECREQDNCHFGNKRIVMAGQGNCDDGTKRIVMAVRRMVMTGRSDVFGLRVHAQSVCVLALFSAGGLFPILKTVVAQMFFVSARA